MLNVNIDAGDTTLEHVHSNDIAIICVSGCEIRTQSLGGTWTDWLVRVPGQVGINANAGNPTTHRHQAGRNRYHVISVENLLQSGWSEGAPTSGPATKLVGETRAFQIYDVRLGVGETEVSHMHAHSVVTVVVAGEVEINGDGQRSAKVSARSGDWAVISGGRPQRIVKRGTADAYVVEVEVR